MQRVSRACVRVGGETVGSIGRGLLILLGVEQGDGEGDARWLAAKLAGLRIFEDEAGKMNLSLLDVGGAALVVSQFTLLGDCRRGRRPGFERAADPATAQRLYERFLRLLAEEGVKEVASGVFRAMMEVELVNDGPVTLVVDTPARGRGEAGDG